MCARDAFGLAVRLAGMTSLAFGVFDAIGVIARLSGVDYGSPRSFSSILTAMVSYAIMGVLLLATAKRITTLVYPDAPKSGE
jgi:hypothetical protein